MYNVNQKHDMIHTKSLNIKKPKICNSSLNKICHSFLNKTSVRKPKEGRKKPPNTFMQSEYFLASLGNRLA